LLTIISIRLLRAKNHMGSSLSTKSQAVSAPEPQVATDLDIVFTAPYFFPVAGNVLAIESIISMGGPRFICALLYSPHTSSGGIAIDGYGRISAVPADRWEEMEDLARRAKEVWVEPGNRASWSRPIFGSCSVSSYYDLGPSEIVGGLSCFHLTTHMATGDSLVVEMGGRALSLPVPKESGILTYKKMDDGTYEKTTVKEIPKSIRAFQCALSNLSTELFPGDSSSAPATVEAKAMLTTVENMSTAVRINLLSAQAFRRANKRNGWFNW
ncbi:hypothetical protein B0H17DRAFT_1047541, partial [Mycena rosella]